MPRPPESLASPSWAAGSFELLGVRTNGESFAIVVGTYSAHPRRVETNDRLGDALVVAIDAGGLTLDAAGEEVRVAVGEAYSGYTTIQ